MPNVRWYRTAKVTEKQEEMKDYTNSQISQLIDDLVHNERDRQIMKRRFIDGVVFEKLAEEFDLSTQRVKAIVYKNWQRIVAHL